MSRAQLVDRVLIGLGPAFVERAGDLLPDVVSALVSELVTADDLLRPVDPTADPDGPRWRGSWAAAFDLDHTPDPQWLGRVTGSRIPDGLVLADARQLVRERASWRRGTPASLIAAVKRTLTGLQRVTLDERDGSPWRLTLSTYEAETPDPDATLAVALTQKPVGIVLVHQVLAGATFGHMTTVHGPTFADEATAFPTFGSALAHLPEES